MYKAQLIKNAMNGLDSVYVTDRKVAEEMGARHLRGGKITKQDTHKGNRGHAGIEVQALGHDDLGNIIYLRNDNIIIQA